MEIEKRRDFQRSAMCQGRYPPSGVYPMHPPMFNPHNFYCPHPFHFHRSWGSNPMANDYFYGRNYTSPCNGRDDGAVLYADHFVPQYQAAPIVREDVEVMRRSKSCKAGYKTVKSPDKRSIDTQCELGGSTLLRANRYLKDKDSNNEGHETVEKSRKLFGSPVRIGVDESGKTAGTHHLRGIASPFTLNRTISVPSTFSAPLRSKEFLGVTWPSGAPYDFSDSGESLDSSWNCDQAVGCQFETPLWPPLVPPEAWLEPSHKPKTEFNFDQLRISPSENDFGLYNDLKRLDTPWAEEG